MEPASHNTDGKTNNDGQGTDKKDCQEGKTRTLCDILEKFGQHSTLHGIYHVTSREKGKCSRITYGLFVLGSLISLVILLAMLMTEARQLNTITRYDVVSTIPMDFPAVRLCNLCPYTFKEPDDPFLEMILAHGESASFQKAVERFNGSEEFLNMSGAELTDRYMVKFEDFVVDSSFNGIKVEPTDWETGLTTIQLGISTNCFIFNGPNYTSSNGPKVSSWVGGTSGLSLLLNIQQYYCGTWQPQIAGAKVFVTHYKESPRVGQAGINVAPGTHTFLALSPVRYSFLPPPYTSFGNESCVEDEDELLSKMVKGTLYDQNECIQQCLALQTSLDCRCSVKGIEELLDFKECKSRDYFTGCAGSRQVELLKDLQEKRFVCDCPRRCSFVDYEMRLSSAMYPSKAASQVVMRSLNETSIERVRDNYLKVDIYIESEFVKHMRHGPDFTPEYILSRIGGQMGLTLGASLITVLEVLDVVCVIIYTSVKQILLSVWIRIGIFSN